MTNIWKSKFYDTCNSFITFVKCQNCYFIGTLGKEEARPEWRNPSAWPEEDEEEKKDDSDEEEERERKRRDEKDRLNSLVVEEGMLVKFPFVSLATCLLPMQIMLEGSFHQEEVKQTQHNELSGARLAPDHLPLVTDLEKKNSMNSP